MAKIDMHDALMMLRTELDKLDLLTRDVHEDFVTRIASAADKCDFQMVRMLAVMAAPDADTRCILISDVLENARRLICEADDDD